MNNCTQRSALLLVIIAGMSPGIIAAQGIPAPDSGAMISTDPMATIEPMLSEPALDAIIQEDILGLRQSGIINLQTTIGNDLIVIDRLKARAEALKGLLESMGVDGLKQFDPELYAAMQESPLVMSQMIEEAKLKQELEDIKNGSLKKEVAVSDVDATDGADDYINPMDAFQSDNFPPVLNQDQPVQQPADLVETQPYQSIDLVETPPSQPINQDTALMQDADELSDVPTIAPPAAVINEDPPISLRAIFGGNGRLKALISHDDEVITVEVGDRLSEDLEIIGVTEDSITIRQGDVTLEIFLRG